MPLEFEYNSIPTRVFFGVGSIERLPEEMKRLGKLSPVILTTPQQVEIAEILRRVLNGKIAGVFSEATMHTPVHITEKAVAYLEGIAADSVVSVGGGSTIGLGKAISIRTGLPHVCIPTTYAGSEMTSILGETKDGLKTTRTDVNIYPSAAIYDTNFTMSLPTTMSATSGINAIAHAVEAMYARQANPIISIVALEGIKALATALPIIVANAADFEARSLALYGAWCCGTCLGSVGMALHHKLCHTLGGSFNLPHAETHTIVLPHVLAYNAPAIPEVMKKLADVLPDSNGDAIEGLNILIDKIQFRKGLKDFGMKESDIDKATSIALSNPYWNPRAIEENGIRELISRAWSGVPAKSNW
ncbi:hypothetical protein V1511DRAFT_506505 [Dipodascopsis uninucleata]